MVHSVYSFDIIEIVNGIKENELEYYKGIRENSDLVYTNALKRKLFISLSKIPIKVLKTMGDLKLRFVKTLFNYWQRKANKKISSRMKVEPSLINSKHRLMKVYIINIIENNILLIGKSYAQTKVKESKGTSKKILRLKYKDKML